MPNNPIWAIQSNKMDTRQVLPVLDAIKRSGQPWIDVAVEFESGWIGPKPEEKNLIPFGSCTLTTLAEAEGWHHLYFDRKTFNVNAWNHKHPAMLNDSRSGYLTTLSGLKVHCLSLAPDYKFFVRPVMDLKEFAGHVITAEDTIKWVENLDVGDCTLKSDCQVYVGTVKDIQMEWRYFIVGGRVVSGSVYRYRGERRVNLETDRHVLSEAQKLADEWLPHPTCVMDVALHEGIAKVVEFNCINASGFYDHDIPAVTNAIYQYALRHNG